MKLSIEAELIYKFATETQIVANLEVSRTSDQSILSDLLQIEPKTKMISDTAAGR